MKEMDKHFDDFCNVMMKSKFIFSVTYPTKAEDTDPIIVTFRNGVDFTYRMCVGNPNLAHCSTDQGVFNAPWYDIIKELEYCGNCEHYDGTRYE